MVQIATVFSGLTEPNRSSRTTVRVGAVFHSPARPVVRELVDRLPASLRCQLIDALLAGSVPSALSRPPAGRSGARHSKSARLLARRHWGVWRAASRGFVYGRAARGLRQIVPGDTLLSWALVVDYAADPTTGGGGWVCVLRFLSTTSSRCAACRTCGAGATRQFSIFFDLLRCVTRFSPSRRQRLSM